jgi:hypothetical protein
MSTVTRRKVVDNLLAPADVGRDIFINITIIFVVIANFKDLA